MIEFPRCLRIVTAPVPMVLLAATLPPRAAAQVMLSPTGPQDAGGSLISVTATAEVEYVPDRVARYVSLSGADTTNQAALPQVISTLEAQHSAEMGLRL